MPLRTLGQHLHHRNSAELTALVSSAFLNLPFRERQRDRAEQSPREQSLISYTLSFNGVNPEVDLCSDRAEIYYTQFLGRGGFGGREGAGQPVCLCSSAAVCPGSGLQVQQSQKVSVDLSVISERALRVAGIFMTIFLFTFVSLPEPEG